MTRVPFVADVLTIVHHWRDKGRIFSRPPIVAALAATIAGMATPASAQTFVDLFAGRSMPERTAATLTADEARIDGVVVPARLVVAIERLTPTDSTIYGVRVGHWFDWFGIALDAATLDPDVKRQTIRATANLRFDEEVFGERVTIDPGRRVSVDIPRVTVPTTATVAALAIVRLPRGRVEPYAFAGPVYLVTDSDLDGDWGLRAGGGLTLPMSRHVALFGEYRYTRVEAHAVAGRIGGSVRGVGGNTGDIAVDLAIRNHSAISGIRFGF
jgi:opacity protein-like surface antigen